MNKKDFLNAIPYSDKNTLSNLYDKLQLASKTGRPIFTNEFYTMPVWKPFIDSTALYSGLGITVKTFGVFEEAERVMLCFIKEDFDDEDTLYYPMVLLKITNKSKFETLEHRDYLGAIMSLGIVREKFGDLIVGQGCCYVPVTEEVSAYIISSLDKIRKSPCEASIADSEEAAKLKAAYEEKNLIATSMRLDCIVSELCNISRSKAEDFIATKKVLVDYAESTEKAFTVKFGSIITIRGFGKFKVMKATGVTAKDRIKLLVKKYK